MVWPIKSIIKLFEEGEAPNQRTKEPRVLNIPPYKIIRFKPLPGIVVILSNIYIVKWITAGYVNIYTEDKELTALTVKEEV